MHPWKSASSGTRRASTKGLAPARFEASRIDDPYEPPLNPEVECHTDLETVERSAAKVWRVVEAALKG